MTYLYSKLIRWAFERFYREFSWTYDTVAALVSQGHWPAWTLAALPHVHGSVLELGCGTGYVQRGRGVGPARFVVGLDISAQMLGHTQRRLRHAGRAARLVRADARFLPFQTHAFDTLVATFPSEYIAAHATLAEAARVLRPGARLVVLLGAQLGGSGVYQWLVDLAYRLTGQHALRGDATPVSASPVVERFVGALQRAGFAAQATWQEALGGYVCIIVGERAA